MSRLIKQVPAGRLLEHQIRVSRIAGDVREYAGLPRGTVEIRCPCCGAVQFELDAGFVAAHDESALLKFCPTCLALPEETVLEHLGERA
ncbi:MAG: zinc finger domain-containing protein [Anaerolineales bacterium]